MNRANLMGHVGNDPEIKVFESGAKMASFNLATTEEYKDRSGETKKDTTWHRIIAWRDVADDIEAQVKKGSHVSVQGKISNRSYVDKAGQKRQISEIVASEVRVTK